MNFKNFCILAITSGLVAGIITTLGNIFISIWEKKSDISLEKMKYHDSLNNYRYMELSKILDAVITTESDCNEKVNEWASEHEGLSIDLFNEESDILDNYFRKMLPLLNSVYRQRIKMCRSEMLEKKKHFYEQCLIDGQNDELQSCAAAFVAGVGKFGNEIIDTLQEQLIRLII